MPRKISSNAAKTTKPAKKKPRGKPFKKNNPVTGERDERINRDGQNAKYKEFHLMLSRLYGEENTVKTATGDQVVITSLELQMRQWIASNDYNKQAKALEYLVGKVPDELRVHSDIEDFIKQNVDLLTDGQITRLKGGENPSLILSELLAELRQAKNDNK